MIGDGNHAGYITHLMKQDRLLQYRAEGKQVDELDLPALEDLRDTLRGRLRNVSSDPKDAAVALDSIDLQRVEEQIRILEGGAS